MEKVNFNGFAVRKKVACTKKGSAGCFLQRFSAKLGVTIFKDFNTWLTGLPVLGQIIGSSTSALGTWYFPEGAMLFAFMGILIGAVYGLKENKIGRAHV